MKKIMRIGKIKIGKLKRDVFISATFEDGKLSISGVIGPLKSGNAYGGCGQIAMEFAHRNSEDNDKRYQQLITPEEITFASGWNKEKWFDLLDIWKNWHLNDMRAGCKHQRDLGWTKKPNIEVVTYSIECDFWRYLKQNDTSYQSVARSILSIVNQVNHYESEKQNKIIYLQPHEYVKLSPESVEKLRKEFKRVIGYSKEALIEKREMKNPIWTYESEHPEGVLMKSCPICGYKYGSEWLKEEVPKEVIDKIESFPDTDIVPAWI